MAIQTKIVHNVQSSRLQIVTPKSWLPDEVDQLLRNYNPKTNLGHTFKRIAQLLNPDEALDVLQAIQRAVVIESELWVKTFYRDRHGFLRLKENFGLTSRKVVTDTGVAFIVDAFQNSVELENMKFHGIGTGSTAEAASQTALVTELTTQYTGNVRATGTTTETAANVYSTVGLNTIDSGGPVTIAEHGVFSQAATGGGVMLDRSLTGSNVLNDNDAIQTDYRLTIASGG
jgi:hypothetical protein